GSSGRRSGGDGISNAIGQRRRASHAPYPSATAPASYRPALPSSPTLEERKRMPLATSRTAQTNDIPGAERSDAICVAAWQRQWLRSGLVNAGRARQFRVRRSDKGWFALRAADEGMNGFSLYGVETAPKIRLLRSIPHLRAS